MVVTIMKVPGLQAEPFSVSFSLIRLEPGELRAWDFADELT
jgi:hypothetical protein